MIATYNPDARIVQDLMKVGALLGPPLLRYRFSEVWEEDFTGPDLRYNALASLSYYNYLANHNWRHPFQD